MPQEFDFPALISLPASGGTTTHQLSNPSDQKMIFKVRSTNNNDYRVNPAYGFVAASANTNIEITRLPGAPVPNDKLVVQFAPAPPDAFNPQEAFSKVEPIGNVTINLVNY
ncbi:MSP domain protein [Dictyocaulus viviparus]|uniref:MSP domain protein n=1 Tax=Dictyocaulus viviparus TaxID=29172 RepID=A0A0D8Y0P6_DICVI|nr:MSP domain protein [Dictyocaulus viviparus]